MGVPPAGALAPMSRCADSKDPQSQLLFSLCINDLVAIPDENECEKYWRVQQISEKRVMLRPHTYAGPASNAACRLLKVYALLLELGAKKVTVDALGRIAYAHD